MLRLWFLILCVIAGAFAPSRAPAREFENRTRDFFAFSPKTHQETESQAVEPHQEKTADGYETALGYPQAAENVAPRLALPHPQYYFKADQAVVHFDRHAGSIMNAMGNKSYNLARYVDDANHVIQTGTWASEMNGFVKLIGGQGSAKFGFVGLERGGSSITTFHIKTASELAKKAPSLGVVP